MVTDLLTSWKGPMMHLARLSARLFVGALAAVLVTTVAAPAAQATARSKPLGTKSLAQVLTKDTSGFDRNPRDFDILTAAVLAVLRAKPASPVKVLTDGKVALTTFVPNDGAFQQLVREITGQRKNESQTFTAVAGLGIDTVETVLLYHVVPGATIDLRAALKADGVDLTTALRGATVEVDVTRYHYCWPKVSLIDADTNDRNPRIVGFDINKGNRQIAHAIDRVLRPLDLP